MDSKNGFLTKLKQSLSKTGGGLLSAVFSGERINEDFYDELEEALIVSDVGMQTSNRLLEDLRETVAAKGLRTQTEAREAFVELLCKAMRPEAPFLPDAGEAVVLVVGVNGVGKTTSIGKLAHYYAQRGRRPLLAAADTFRAAAAEQLTIWSQRADVPIVKHGEGADPAAVVYDAIGSYRAKQRDLLICDTAGRLHNKKNLMSELEKIRRVIARELPETPVEVLLVLDATTGQNAIAQAKAFHDSAGLTGIILTKLDGTAKGGVAVAVRDELNIPIRFAGVGEGMDDLQPFDAKEYAEALLQG